MRPAVLVVGLIVLVLGLAAPASAQQMDRDGCLQMAIWGHDVVWARDMGADRAKVRAYLDEKKAAAAVFAALLRLFDQLWETRVARGDIADVIFRACVVRRGDFGTDT